MNGKHYYTSLTRKMVLVIVLVSFTPLTLIAGLIGYYFETSYRQEALASLHELVQKHQQHIDSYLNETLGDMRFLAESYSYDELTSQGFLQNRLLILQDAYPGVFADLGVVNSAGEQISYAGSFELLHADYSSADWFRKAMTKDEYLSDVFLGLRHKPHFIICIRKRRGDSTWLLRATVNFADFNSLVGGIRIGKTGSAFIVNNAGDLQSRPGTEPLAGLLRMTPWADGQEAPAAGRIPEVKTISSGADALTGTVKNGKNSFLFILMPLKSGQWTLVYQQELDDAFPEIRSARALALSIFFFGCATILLATLFVSRKVVRRIEEADLEKEKMNEQVTEARKMASIGELAAGVAHEINNPVAIMVEEAGWMQDLLEEGFEKNHSVDEFRHCLEQINLQGIRCKEITQKLLSLARKTDSARRTFQLNSTIVEVLGFYEQLSKSNNIQIRTELDQRLPMISASPTEMHQVFMNLINNAFDAMGSKGGSLEIRSRVAAGRVVVDVADTGRGIPKTVMERMFDPFFTTKPAGKGTGLGLSICYGIVKNLGGNLTVDSTVGVGTTFHVHIPAHAESS